MLLPVGSVGTIRACYVIAVDIVEIIVDIVSGIIRRCCEQF